jgi:ubiquinone/menaquinone biosynthesis C-methylase UbiE
VTVGILYQLKHKIIGHAVEIYLKCCHVISNFFFYLPLGGQTAFQNKVLKFAGLEAGDRVLDLCCGTGKLSDVIANQGIPVDVVGIDISGPTIEQAIKKVQQLSVSFLKASASDLPLQSSRFDKCIICFGLHHIPENDRQKALKEVYRTLVREGTVFIIDYNLPERGLRRLAAATFIRLDNRGEALKMLKSGKLVRQIEEAGFEIVERVLTYQGMVQLLKVAKR